MKNTLKKLGAIALVLMLMMSLSVSAFAADMSGKAGAIGEFTTPDQPTEQGTSVKIYKEITALNPESCTVNAPAITFNYTITSSSALAGKTIIDNASHHDPSANAQVLTKQGIGTPTITGTAAGVLELSPTVETDQLKASENGTANRFPLTVSFAGIDFATAPGTGAGVYRYQIDETTTEATKNASGIAEGSGANTLYMDVYVNGDGQIYGYVLFTTNGDIDATTSDEAAATAAGKVEGFVGNKADDETYDSEAASTADKYYTFNLDLTKDVVNDAYAESTHHQFPFTVTLANSSVTAAVLPIMTVGTNATQTALTAAAINGQTWTPTIADGATINYVGIPCGTTITVKEKNDVTGVTYTSVSTNADTNATAKVINTNDESNNAIISCGATALAKATENHTTAGAGVLTFTNTLVQISPTGVVMRVAPYMLMLAAGIVLLVISRRRKVEEA